MKTRSLTASLSLLLLLAAFSAAAQTMPVELEIGYRWTDVSGNEDLYRTQINEDEGFVIRSLSFFAADLAGTNAMDHFRLDAADLGAGPAQSLRIDTGKTGRYRLRLGYRSFDVFSALPAFANPLLAQGVVPGQHTFDRTRTMFDADVEFLGFGRLTPFIGYSYNHYDGPGTTTYFLGGDEFRLDSDLDESDRELRAGTSFRVGKFSGQVTQGWRSLASDETLTLAAGAGSGNDPGSILGEPVSTDSLTRTSSTDGDTPFTNLYVMGEVTERIRLIADYVRSGADSDGVEDESATGSFVSFALGRFFDGFRQTISSRGRNDTWHGGVRAAMTVADGVVMSGGYRSEHRELEGSSLVTSLFLDSITFGGVDPRDVEEILRSNSSLERDEDVVGAGLDARALGPWSVRVGFSNAKQDVRVAPDLSEIVLPGNQGGDFERDVFTVDGSVSYTRSLFSLGASYRIDEADDPVLRTDFLDRDRLRIRASFHTPGNLLRSGLTAERTDQDNTRGGIGYDAETRLVTADLEVGPLGALQLRGSYSQLRADSTIIIRRPETFALDRSVHEEDGDAIELGVALLLSPVSFEATVSRFQNEGTLPFDVDRYRLRAVYDFRAGTGIAAEWARDDYEEDQAYGRFSADRVGLFLRWRS